MWSKNAAPLSAVTAVARQEGEGHPGVLHLRGSAGAWFHPRSPQGAPRGVPPDLELVAGGRMSHGT